MAPKPKEKPKPTPPPPTQSPPLEDLFSSLHRHIQNYEYDQAAKLADQVLSIAPGDEDAVRCKIVALIKSDAIDKALNAINGVSSLPIDLSFYKAYCLYRQNKLQEALDVLQDQEKTPTVLQLESQIFYRLGQMESCMESFEKLQRFKMDSLDLKTNMIAALISAGRASEVEGTMNTLKVKSSSSFELAYNTACSLIEKKKFAEAEQQLLSARRIGQEMLMEEDYADEEIETELAPIAVQLAYVHQLMGNTQESMDKYIGIINRNLGDSSSLAVAINNLISLRGTKDLSDSNRKLDKLIEKSGGGAKSFQFANGLDFKLTSRQREALYSNRVLLLLQANKIDQAQELVSAIQEMYPSSPTPVLLQAAVFVREKKIPKAEEILNQFSTKYPEKSQPVLLSLAQISALAGHFQISFETLSKIHQIQHLPATVATLVSLKERLNDFNSAFSVLDSSIQWWKDSMDGERKLWVIMQEAASFKLKHGREEEASRMYEELLKGQKGTNNMEALVGLVTTCAKTNLEKAEFYEKQLKPLPGLKGINVEMLEKSSGAKHVESVAHTAKMEVSDEVKKAKAKKRKRKPKYPKGFDPANPGPPPDPERWLPKRERSTYRPKRKDKRAQIRGAQGAVSRDKHDIYGTSTGTGTNADVVPNKPKEQASKGSSKSRKKSRT